MRIQLCSFIIFSFALSSIASAQDYDQNQSDSNLGEVQSQVSKEPPHGPDEPKPSYIFPNYEAKYAAVAKSLWEKTQRYYDQYQSTFANKRYVTMINLGLHSTAHRFYLLDLEDGTLRVYLTSHGAGSDPNKDGFTDKFSNDQDSRASSLGAYETVDTYNGKHGRSLRLNGLEATNNNALTRAVVIHGASYVNEKTKKVGMSWGCPALDDDIVQPIIDKLQNGSLLMIDSIK